MKIGIVGFGNMGSSFYYSLKDKFEVIVYTKSLDKVKDKSVKLVSSLKELKENTDIILLAIKPKDLRNSKELDIINGKIIISMLPTVTIKELKERFPNSKVIRIMPNINVRFKKRVIGIVKDNLTEEDKNLIEKLFSEIASLYYLNEDLIDNFAIFAASTPAFFAEVIEGFILAGIESGFDFNNSLEITLTMMEGTINYLRNVKNTNEVIYRVSSPGGLTIKGIHNLEKSGIKGIIMDSIFKSIERLKR